MLPFANYVAPSPTPPPTAGEGLCVAAISERAAEASPSVSGEELGRGPHRLRLAALVVLIAAGLGMGRTEARRLPSAAAEVEQLAAIELATLPAGPLFLGLAQIVVPPGVGTTDAATPGPRLIVMEAGTLTVTTAGPAEVLRASFSNAPARWTAVPPGSVVILGSGDRLVLAADALGEVRNDGARAAVYLDAALFAPGPRPIDPAFTTADGISFQLLVGAIADVTAIAPAEFALARLHLPRGEALPATPRVGPAVVYVESGSLEVVPTAMASAGVQFSRAAAPAPFSTAGPLREVPLGARLRLTAGGALFVPDGAAISAANERDVPAVVLLVELRPVGGGAATPAAPWGGG
jgi:hypothetical protein